MAKCEKFIEEIVRFIEENSVDDFEMSREDTINLMGYYCDEEDDIKPLYLEKYVHYTFGHSQEVAFLAMYNTFEELEKALLSEMGSMFSSYNFPIINGKVPKYKMMHKENGEWKVCKYSAECGYGGKDKKIVWEENNLI